MRISPSENCDRLEAPLLGAASEEPQDNSSGRPIVILVQIRAEGSPVVVDIEQANFKMAQRSNIHSAARLVGDAILGSFCTGDGDIDSRAANQSFQTGAHT